jgi:hypothetical protein
MDCVPILQIYPFWTAIFSQLRPRWTLKSLPSIKQSETCELFDQSRKLWLKSRNWALWAQLTNFWKLSNVFLIVTEVLLVDKICDSSCFMLKQVFIMWKIESGKVRKTKLTIFELSPGSGPLCEFFARVASLSVINSNFLYQNTQETHF